MNPLPIVVAKSILTQQLQMNYNNSADRYRTQSIYYIWQECISNLGYYFYYGSSGPWSRDLNTELEENHNIYENLNVEDTVLSEKAIGGIEFFRTLNNPIKNTDKENYSWLRLIANLICYSNQYTQESAKENKDCFVQKFIDSNSLAHQYKDVIDIAFEQLRHTGASRLFFCIKISNLN